jgi:hypothetical protein
VQVQEVEKYNQQFDKKRFRDADAAIEWLRHNINPEPEEFWGYSDPRDYIGLANEYLQSRTTDARNQPTATTCGGQFQH